MICWSTRLIKASQSLRVPPGSAISNEKRVRASRERTEAVERDAEGVDAPDEGAVRGAAQIVHSFTEAGLTGKAHVEHVQSCSLSPNLRMEGAAYP